MIEEHKEEWFEWFEWSVMKWFCFLWCGSVTLAVLSKLV